MSTAAHATTARLGALRLPPFLAGLAAERGAAALRGWPAWLPAPANRPDESRFADTQAGEPEAEATTAETTLPGTAAYGGWFDSSLDLKHGLEVVDLGPVEWLDEWDGAFAGA